jgi:hypothetical protein
MIPHDGNTRRVKDAASMINMVLFAAATPMPLSFTPKPDLGNYQACDPIPRKPVPVRPDLPRIERGGKRVDPVAEYHRLKAKARRSR